MQGADGDFHGHSLHQLSHFGLVDIAAEDEVVHVGHAGNGGTVVERIAQDDRVAHLYGNVEDDAADGGAHERARGLGIALRHTVANHLQVIVGGSLLLLGLLQRLAFLFKLVGTDQFFLEQFILALEVDSGLCQVNLSQAHAALGRTELRHVGNHLHLGDDFSRLHIVAGLLHNLRDDAAHLRFHVHFVARLNLSRHDGCLTHVFHLWREFVVNHFFGLRLLP